MSVYVDNQRNIYGRMAMCHMIADSLDELHETAAAIGLKKEWFQNKKGSPHYDLSLSKRKLAIEHGAIEIGDKELVEVLRAWRMTEGMSDWTSAG